MHKLLTILFCFHCFQSFSHPGIGIVKDSKGSIYFTDLEQVWKVDPNTLKKIVVVPGVHTHELYMDKHDNLFGQHLLYSGEQTNRWSHYVWKVNNKGILDTVVPLTDGFYIENFSFVGDKKGNQYWIQHWKTDRIIKKQPDGKSEVLYEGDLKNVQWMYPYNDRLYFVKEDDIYFVDQQRRLHLYAKDLAGKKKEGHNSIFGMWSDDNGNLFIANSDLKKVQKLDSSGTPIDIYKTEKGWIPTGGLFDDKGNLWVLECSSTNEVRVQKVNKAGQTNVSETEVRRGSVNFILLIAAGISITTAFLVSMKRKA